MPNSFYEITVALIPEPHKKQIMKIYVKILNEILAIKIQEHSPLSRFHFGGAGLVQNMTMYKYNPLYKQTEKQKNHMIILLDAEKAFDKI